MYRITNAHSLLQMKARRKYILLKYARHSYLKTICRRSPVQRAFDSIFTRWLHRLQAVQRILEERNENLEEEEMVAAPFLLDSG